MTRRALLAVAFAALSSSFVLAADKKMTFEIYSDKGGEFRWRLKDGEGTNVANSGQGYKQKKSCADMVDNLKADISKYTIEVYEDNKKESRFKIIAKNGNQVGASTGSYKTKAEAEKAVEAIKAGAKDAEVKDETPKKK